MVTYTIEIIFGLAGTILMITVMSVFYDTKTLVIYSILPQILTGSIGLLRSPKTVNLDFLFGMLSFAALGSIAGLYLFYHFSVALFHTLLACAVIVFGTYLVISPGRLRLNRVTSRILDTLAGVSQALFGISGPIAMTRLMGTFKEKLLIRNYALAFFMSLNLFRAGGYIFNHTLTPNILEMMLYSGPILAITLWNSNHLHLRINETVFKIFLATEPGFSIKQFLELFFCFIGSLEIYIE